MWQTFLVRPASVHAKGLLMSITPLARAFSILGALVFPVLAQAQTGIVVAGSGYRNPSNTVTAAPGQILTVSVFGVAARFPKPVFPVTDNGYPTTVQGVSVNFVQGPVTVQLPIMGVQQTSCPSSAACSPATTFTLQIPYELDPGSADAAGLQVQENGATSALVVLNRVTDNVHVINTCDQTGIFLSAAYGEPAGACVPMVMHAGGPLVDNTAPAKPGETLVLWAYGLGAIDHPIPFPCCSSPDQLPLAVQPFNVSFSYLDAGGFPMKRLGVEVPSYVGMTGAGLYQVQFVVPAAPASLFPCGGISTNLTIQVSGPASADTAAVCLQP
jgi:uncharacterized protein (TIGR03437 family)